MDVGKGILKSILQSFDEANEELGRLDEFMTLSSTYGRAQKPSNLAYILSGNGLDSFKLIVNKFASLLSTAKQTLCHLMSEVGLLVKDNYAARPKIDYGHLIIQSEGILINRDFGPINKPMSFAERNDLKVSVMKEKLDQTTAKAGPSTACPTNNNVDDDEGSKCDGGGDVEKEDIIFLKDMLYSENISSNARRKLRNLLYRANKKSATMAKVPENKKAKVINASKRSLRQAARILETATDKKGAENSLELSIDNVSG